jgi:hypothetical protein
MPAENTGRHADTGLFTNTIGKCYRMVITRRKELPGHGKISVLGAPIRSSYY